MAALGTTRPPPGGLPATTFFSKIFDEALDLLGEARAYLEASCGVRFGRPAHELVHSLETLRLTTRLTQIMAWLLVQRAVHAGEMTPAQAGEAPNRLDAQVLCLEAGGEKSPALPDVLRVLLRRSRKLYRRIARLNEMVARDGA